MTGREKGLVRPVPPLAITFLKRAEGLRLTAYLDGGGVPTIGYGHTGADIRPGLRITRAKAEALLAADAREAARRLAERVSAATLAGLSEHQYAALISFSYNLGAAPQWTIWRLLNDGDLEGVPAQMLRFNRVRRRGRLEILEGLTQRRAAEVALWLSQDAAAAGAIAASSPAPPSSETRRADTPPTPTSPQPLARNGAFGAAVAAAAAATPIAIDQAKSGAMALTHLVSPYADRSALLQEVLGVLAVLCAALAVASAVLQYLKHRREKRA